VELRRDQLVTRLIRAGELEISGEDQPEADSCFDTDKFRFYGPDGFEADYAGSPTISCPYGRRSMIDQSDGA